MPKGTKEKGSDHNRPGEPLERKEEKITTRLNADIPKELHKKIKILAASRDVSITLMVQDALNEYLLKHSDVNATTICK